LQFMGNVSFSGVSVRNGVNAAGATCTITPDRDNSADAAIIRGAPPSGIDSWQVLISSPSDPNHTTPLRVLYGYGSPPEVSWYGYDDQGRTVPNATYLVRLQTHGGAIKDDSLTVTVNSANIAGTVENEIASPVSGARVDVYGPGGGGFATTDAGGSFVVNGLVSGQSYGVNISSGGHVSKSYNNHLAGTALPDVPVVLSRGANLVVTARRALGTGTDDDPSFWANLQARTTDYAYFTHGGLYFDHESSTGTVYSSDGTGVSTKTVMGVPPGKQIVVRLEAGYVGISTETTVTAPAAGGSLQVYFSPTALAKKASISGWVSISTDTTFYGQWVSVQGRKIGESQPSVFGGGWIDQSHTSAPYVLFGIADGDWEVRTHAQGFQSSSTTVTVSGGADQTGVNFGPLGTGGVVSGTLNLIGDSSAVEEGFGGDCSSGKLGVPINAWSPSTYQGSWKSVCVSTGTADSSQGFSLAGLDDGTYEVHAHVPGFQLDPPGRRTVTVSGGSGSLTLNYRKLSGAVEMTVRHAAGANPSLIGYRLSSAFGGGDGGGSFEGIFGAVDGTTARATVGGLGTGLYAVDVQDMNPGKGLAKRAGAAVVNGSTAAVTIDMRDTTYSVSGVVSFGENVLLPFPWSMTVSSAAGLAALDSDWPEVQVFSFPLPEHFHGDVRPYRTVTAAPETGTFTVTGLPPGGYLFRVKNDLNPPTNTGGGQAPPGLPEFATSGQVVFVSASDVTGSTLTLSNGVNLAASLTVGDTTNARLFELTLRRSDNLTVYQASMTTTGGSASYTFQHLANGDYTLEARELYFPAKYFVSPKKVSIAGAAQSVTLTPQTAGMIVGKLRDADSNTLISSDNVGNFLPQRFRFYARANPWVPGGHVDMARCHETSGATGGGCSSDIYISSVTGQFAIHRVPPGNTYDVTFNGLEQVDPTALSKGQKAYSPVSLSGIKVEEGQTVDLGIVDLTQGVNLSGVVTDKAGTPLSNIQVAAYPSQLDGGDRHDFTVTAYTDAEGKFIIPGVDRNRRFYEVIASPRMRGGDAGQIEKLLSNTKYAEERIRNLDTQDTAARNDLSFALTVADGVLTGSVSTADGGPLEKPFNDKGGFSDRRAMVTLALNGAISSADNPLGEIEEATDPQGNFRIQGLKPGSYTMRVISVGYITDLRTVVVRSGTNNAGAITLQKGASLSGSIAKPDGSSPNTGEVKFIVGVDQDFEEFVFASLTKDTETDQVTGYTLDGFKVGPTYSIVAGNDGDDILELESGITFASSTETKTQDLVYRPAPPAVFVTQSKSGDSYTLKFFSTHKLRNVTADDDNLMLIATKTAGAGDINYSSSSISSSRDTVYVVYDAAPAETSFKISLAFTSIVPDPESVTGSNFSFSGEFQFFAGVSKSRLVRIPTAIGGDCSLEGSAAGGSFPAGTFAASNGSVLVSSNVQVGVRTAEAIGSLGFAGAPSSRARALGMGEAARRLGPAAYPSSELFKAASAAPSVNPFSNFYDIFLPAGVSHSLKQDALITLSYDASVADPTSINVYYFDEGNNVYLLESGSRQVDTVNRTITVAVKHLSTFVVLAANAQVVGTNSYAGTEISVHNFPNPFNLNSKTVSLANASPPQSVATDGTVIRYALPAGKTGTVKIDIYDVAGGLVKSLSESAPTGGSYYYTTWDGKNDEGKKVASGVYLARFTLNDGDEKFFKMAVLK
jgi:hypothetical protein